MNIQKQTIPTTNYESGRRGKSIRKIVIHWFGVGKLTGADAHFKKLNSTSAHYGIEDETVYQWVNVSDTAYHAGDFNTNLESVGVEHSAEPGRAASDKTYETSAQLIATLSKAYNIPLNRQHIVKHSEVKATQCPGTMDLDRLIRRALEINSPTMNEDKRLADEMRKITQHNSSLKDAASVLKALSDKDGVIGRKDDDIRRLGEANGKLAQQLAECKLSANDNEFTKLGHSFAENVKKAQSL